MNPTRIPVSLMAAITCLAMVLVAVATGCSVMTPAVQDDALPPLPYLELVRQAGEYKNQTVILGGYVISVENQKAHTRMEVVQAPLGVGQKPKSKDLSEGRLVLIYEGFLDPEVYTKDRQITVGGQLLGSSATESDPSYPYLRVQVRDIHLWPVEKPFPPNPHWNDYGYPFHYPWWHHRYQRY